MKAILKLEFKRDSFLLISSTLSLLAVGFIKFIYSHDSWVTVACWIIIYALSILIMISIPVNSFTKDKLRKCDEYLLTLPIKRWRTLLGKVLYSLIIIVSLVFIVLVIPDCPGGFKEKAIYFLLSNVSGYASIYLILLATSFVFMAGSLPVKGQSAKPDKYQIISAILFSLMFALPFFSFMFYSEYMENSVLSFLYYYKIIILPLLFATFGSLIVYSTIIFCRYKISIRIIPQMFIGYLITFIILFLFQSSYSYLHLKSSNAVERNSSIGMFLYPWEKAAFASFEEAFNKWDKKENLCSLSKPFMIDTLKARKLRNFWSSNLDNDSKIKQAISITELSLLGENDNVFETIRENLINNPDFRQIFPAYEWAERLIFLAPPEKRYDITIELLQSEDKTLKHIGYFCARFFPRNEYMPLILNNIQGAKWDDSLQDAMKSISIIALDEKAFSGLSVTNFGFITENLYKWYNENKDNNFDTRFLSALDKKGYQITAKSIANIPDEQLVRIYLSEDKNCECNDIYLYVITKVLRYRFNEIYSFEDCNRVFYTIPHLSYKIDRFQNNAYTLPAQ